VSRTAASVRGPQGSPGLGRWRGSWTSGTPADGFGAYTTNDLVVYNGTTYRANQVPTVGVVPLNDLKWDIVAQCGANGSNGTSGVSFTYQGAWVSGTPYIIGQWVTYGGSLYYCNGGIVSLSSPPNVDVGWNLGLAASGAGLVAGQVPQAALRAAAYLFTVGAGSANQTALSVNNITASPIYIPAATTIDRISLYIVTGVATAGHRLGVYTDTGSMYPGALLFDGGSIDSTASATVRENTPGTAVAAPRGVYWVAAKHETAVATARGTTGPVHGVLPASNTSTTDLPAGYLCTYSSAGLPANWPAWGVAGTGTVNSPARVGVRVTG
jgi:hypothetical protein